LSIVLFIVIINQMLATRYSTSRHYVTSSASRIRRHVFGVTYSASRIRRHVFGVTYSASRIRRYVFGASSHYGRRVFGTASHHSHILKN